MSWFLDDKNGYLGDFATYQGVRDMRALNIDSLNEFLHNGVARSSLINRLVEDLKAEPSLAYLAKLLNKAEPPVMLSDGVEVEQ